LFTFSPGITPATPAGKGSPPGRVIVEVTIPTGFPFCKKAGEPLVPKAAVVSTDNTFGKLCGWLGEAPAQFLGLDGLENQSSPNQDAVATFAGHFKSDQTPKQATVDALAKMMLLAIRTKPKTPSEDH
jgi:hypothetical protein